jgi:hypothetical protein
MIRPARIAFNKRIIPAAIFDREKRPRSLKTAYGRARIWLSKCGRYRVLCTQSLYGSADEHYPPHWSAQVRLGHQSAECPRELWTPIAGSPFGGPGPAFAAVRRAVEYAKAGEGKVATKARKGEDAKG